MNLAQEEKARSLGPGPSRRMPYTLFHRQAPVGFFRAFPRDPELIMNRVPCIALCIVAAHLLTFAALLLLLFDPTRDLVLIVVLLAIGVIFAAVPRFLRRR